MKKYITSLFLIFLFLSNSSYSQNINGSFGIRGGLGTDINLGLAYGIGINYLLPKTNFEFTVVIFGNHTKETTQEFYTYDETTDIFVFGVLGNYLIGYNRNEPGVYGIAGFGFSGIGVNWEETSSGDPSLGTPLPNGGSKQSESGTAGGSVINVGGGYSFGQVNLRAEFPVIFDFSPPGSASSVIPTFIFTVGINF